MDSPGRSQSNESSSRPRNLPALSYISRYITYLYGRLRQAALIRPRPPPDRPVPFLIQLQDINLKRVHCSYPNEAYSYTMTSFAWCTDSVFHIYSSPTWKIRIRVHSWFCSVCSVNPWDFVTNPYSMWPLFKISELEMTLIRWISRKQFLGQGGVIFRRLKLAGRANPYIQDYGYALLAGERRKPMFSGGVKQAVHEDAPATITIAPSV